MLMRSPYGVTANVAQGSVEKLEAAGWKPCGAASVRQVEAPEEAPKEQKKRSTKKKG